MPYDTESGVVTRSFGPQLLFRGRHESSRGPRWALRIVVGWDPKLMNPGKCPVLTVDPRADPRVYRGWRRYECLVGTTVAYVMWSIDIDVKQGDESAEVKYRVDFGTESREHTFWVPASHSDAYMVYLSCNDIENPLTRNPNAYASWQHLISEHIHIKPVHLIIAGGDQIYGDESLNPKLEGKKEKLEAMYLNEYLCRFADEQRMATAMATIPFIMQPDDHDYYNGVGSWGKEEPKVARTVAHRMRFMFQLGRPASEAYLFDRYEESSDVYVIGPNVVILSLDMRSNRDVHRKHEPMMFRQTWKGLMTRLKNKTLKPTMFQQPKHLMVLFAVPLMFMQSHAVTKVTEVFHHELKTDFRDSPLSKYNKEQTQEMLTDLFDLAKSFSVRLTLVSGDAHCWGTGSVKSRHAHHLPFEQDHRAAVQWISSPMCNTPEKAMETMHTIAKFIGKAKRKIDEVEMTLGKLHGERNYMKIYIEPTSNELHGIFVRDKKGDGVFTDDEPRKVAPLTMGRKASKDQLKKLRFTAGSQATGELRSPLEAAPLADQEPDYPAIVLPQSSLVAPIKTPLMASPLAAVPAENHAYSG
jgi:hypothetical protein